MAFFFFSGGECCPVFFSFLARPVVAILDDKRSSFPFLLLSHLFFSSSAHKLDRVAVNKLYFIFVCVCVCVSVCGGVEV